MIKILFGILIITSIIDVYESKRRPGKSKTTSGKNIARATRGFKYQGKFYKVLGPKGKGRIAFQKLEETRRSTEEVNVHETGKELEVQEKEEVYIDYLEQRKIARSHGLDPDLVDIPKEAIEFLKENHVGKTKKRRRKTRRKSRKGRQKEKHRWKRFAVADTGQSWTKAIVPYVFTEDVSSDEKKYGRLRAQTRYEYWTCIRFVPWSSNTSTMYGLDHNNYLKHIQGPGCWAVLGNTKGDGQKISCCMDETCIHELGHSLGLHHEQKNYLHDDLVRVNYENVDKSKVKEFLEVEPASARTFGYYDLSSRMHYGLFSFNKNAKPVMTINDPELEFMVLAPDPYHYYQFYEVSTISKCRELKCRNFKRTCDNGGYIAYIRGRCTCRCPDGLDPATGCQTKYYGDISQSFLWPSEGFSLLRPIFGCPQGFVALSMSSAFLKKNHDAFSTFRRRNENEPKFCTKLTSEDKVYSYGWQPGEYCIFQYEDKCPTGFSRVQNFDNQLKRSAILKHFLCCRNDGNRNVPIRLPNNHPFILVQYSERCQRVRGMIVKERLISNDTPYDDSDAIGSHIFNDGIIPCYYTPINDASSFSSWPNEDFAVLKTEDGCPYHFQESRFPQQTIDNQTSNSFHLDTKFSDNKMEFKVCVNRNIRRRKTLTIWEPGQYCILKTGKTCPQGFYIGNIKPTTVEFCCREDGSTLDHIVLPNTQPFALFKKNKNSCQSVKDMNVQEEWYMIRIKSSQSFTISGNTPKVRDMRNGRLYFYICYYWPVDYDCGGTINLNAETPRVTITSPNFPDVYNNRQTCAWTIMSPSDTQLVLNFDYFDIEAGLDDSCIDALEVRFNLPGQPGINYCGETFNATTISQMNYLGLILSTGLTGQRPGFSATVNVLSEDELCYTKKGEDYRGTVNITRKFEACLPWSHVTHCRHHMFHIKDLEDGLEHNYCRNPGDGTKPWCYTHSEDCIRDYCDVCKIERCYDIFDDCDKLIMENQNFCSEDGEAKRGCRKFCGFCDTTKPTPIKDVYCEKPDDIPDSFLQSDLKEVYSVGEEVTYKCKTGPEKETRKCLANGSWSTVGFVCGRCPSGWMPYKESCYKWFDIAEDKAGSISHCRKHNASIVTAKDADENAFLASARSESRQFWLGLTYNQQIGDHIWDDDETMVTWSNWRKGKRKCAYFDMFGEWRGIGCQAAHFLSVMCQFKPSDVHISKAERSKFTIRPNVGWCGLTDPNCHVQVEESKRRICTDVRPDCDDMISEEPSSCTDYPHFARQVCPKSCGLCKNGRAKKCRKNRTPRHSKELTGLRRIKVGKMFEFMCEEGYTLKSGNLRRACLKTGQLTGHPPKCVARLEERNNNVDIRERRQDVKGDIAVTALNDEMRIHKAGRIVAWEFYSLYSGDVTFQIWRIWRGRSIFQLIGQNTIRNSKDDRKSRVNIARSEQISVQKGDIIGIFVPQKTMSGMTYDKCITEYADSDSGEQLQAAESKTSSADWIVGETYAFVPAKEECKIFSVTAYIL